ncbi:hypothetical protein ABN151_00675 [Klebsiella oxytoca]|uniref:hypothetical protein n=1 Tax=Klebsiella oxytoca TaxID=571 RepID=UPI0032DB4FD3
MNAKEIDGVFHCDCGFSWSRGKNGSHNCADGLREKVQQLAAENVGLKLKGRELLNEASRVYQKYNATIDFYSGDFMDGQTLHEFQFVLDADTPATDRIVAEAEARGVEKFAAHLRANDNGTSVCKMIALGADDFAKQLRDGGNGE